jgi:hypothetical protein
MPCRTLLEQQATTTATAETIKEPEEAKEATNPNDAVDDRKTESAAADAELCAPIYEIHILLQICLRDPTMHVTLHTPFVLMLFIRSVCSYRL